MKRILTLCSLLLLPFLSACGAPDSGPGNIGSTESALTVACGAPTPWCPDTPACHLTNACPQECSCPGPVGRKACPFFRVYCPADCQYDDSCPGRCHCNSGVDEFVLCGPHHCNKNDVCCTGPIVNGQPNYQCQPQGTACAL